MTIKHIHARQILDSRGNPTVEVEISDGKNVARAAVPSGASTGSHEAHELRDGDKELFGGKSVYKAVSNVNDFLAKELIGFDPVDQMSLDKTMIELDGTEHKSKLGANAILGVSLAAARLAAMQRNVFLFEHIQDIYGSDTVSLPRPMMNIINGGQHADSGLAIQEFMVFPNFGDFKQNLQAGSEIFHNLKKILSAQGHAVGVGDEGGFAPHLDKVEQAFEVICEAVEKTGYKMGSEIELAIDAAASEFYKDGVYSIDGKELNSAQLTDYYLDLLTKFPLTSIEDSHDEDDFDGFAALTAKVGDNVQLVGDDLLVTNIKRLEQGIEKKTVNSILIKVNQIGSLTETFETMRLAKANNFTTVVSHRSGETEDTFIADLAVGTNAGQIKTGSLCRSERVGKYNQLLRIGEVL